MDIPERQALMWVPSGPCSPVPHQLLEGVALSSTPCLCVVSISPLAPRVL